MKRWKMPLIYCLSSIVLIAFGIAIDQWHFHEVPPKVGSEVRQFNPEYKFINPILLAEIGEKNQFPQYDSYTKNIQSYITSAVTQKKAAAVSVYLRDLNNASWTGLNEDMVYAPASMLKVALMIAYLKEAESNPLLLDKRFLYQGNDNSIQYFKPQNPLQQGKLYTVRELIQDMIVQSSNVSNDVLLKNIDQRNLAKVYTDLGLPIPNDKTINFVSPKMYSALFRTLFSSTYLTRPYSNAALELLTHSDFFQGIEAGVPQSVVVAHKFGERTKDVNGIATERQLHDCGISYYPDHPYFLCIMTRGTSFDDLQNIIEDISKITYQSIPEINQLSLHHVQNIHQ